MAQAVGLLKMESSADRFVCMLCYKRKFRKLSGYLLHLRIRHASESNFRVVCGISGCGAQYDKYASLYKHICRHHRHLLPARTTSIGEENCTEDDDDDEKSDGDSLQGESDFRDVREIREQCFGDLGESVFKYSLKLREKCLIPASSHADIISDCKSLISSVLACQNKIITSHLTNKGYDLCHDEELVQHILSPHAYDRLWNECDSSYKLYKNCSRKMNMITPRSYAVGNHKNYYVPVTEILKMLVQKEDIWPFVLHPCIASSNTELTSFGSSDVLKSVCAVRKDGHLLLLHLYNDEFEIVNPIGSKRGKHKLNATYFTLGNLPNKYRSSLQHIHLLNIVKHNAVKEMGYSEVLAPLVDELVKLYTEGFTMTLPDGSFQKFYAILCTVSGDNLSSHALAGFRTVFSSGRVCRMCMIAHDDVASTVCETQVTLRCAETHAYHVQAVKENPDNAAIYGVTGPSVFQRLDYFDVVQGFPPDIMHDCCEGVMPAIVYGIVKHLVDEKITTVRCINQKIASFVFQGADRVNKPEPFRSDCSIIGSASQKMCLFRLLPFFVDLELCPDALKLYGLSREVMMFVFSRCVSREDLAYIEQKIEALRICINEHFPRITVTPKFHYLIHYPTMMTRFGPLRNLWCMRFEAKHQYFKSVAASVGNFVNIAHTLATRHQMLQCYLFSSENVLKQEVILPNSGKLISYISLPTEVQRNLCYATSRIWSIKNAAVNGREYTVGAAVVIDFTADGDPVCILITHLLQPHEGHIDIVGRLLVPDAFCKKLFAYHVVDCGWAYCHPGNERDCCLLWPYEISSEMYISLPYHIPAWSCV